MNRVFEYKKLFSVVTSFVQIAAVDYTPINLSSPPTSLNLNAEKTLVSSIPYNNIIINNLIPEKVIELTFASQWI